jgi:hypothetical protein
LWEIEFTKLWQSIQTHMPAIITIAYENDFSKTKIIQMNKETNMG